MLGVALLGQQKVVDAEPLLLEGFDGVRRNVAAVPPLAKPRVAETLERVVNLYDQMGEKNKTDGWRMKLAEWQAASANQQ